MKAGGVVVGIGVVEVGMGVEVEDVVIDALVVLGIEVVLE
jgi:hypothetical protein